MNRVMVFGGLVVGCVAFLFCLKHFWGKNECVKYIEIFFLSYLYGLLYFTFFKRGRECAYKASASGGL